MTFEQTVTKYRSGDLSLTDLINSCEECQGDWGSCQYDTACSMFLLMDLLQKNGYDPFDVINIHFDLPTPNSADISVVVEKFATDLSKHIEDCYSEEYSEECRKIREKRLNELEIMKMNGHSSLDSVFKTTKTNSWDLWTTVLTVGDQVYGEEYTNYLKETIGKSPGFGPKFNVLVQSQNYIVGAICYRLYADDLITDPHTAYDGFDT